MKLILLYTASDPECSEIMEVIGNIQAIREICTPVDVSHSNVYNILKTSTNITITEFPTLISIKVVNGTKKIYKYEGYEKCARYIEGVLENIKRQDEKQQQQQEESFSTGATSLNDIGLGNIQEKYEPKPSISNNTKESMNHSSQKSSTGMPIKNKRNAKQVDRIGEFMKSRSNQKMMAQKQDNSSPQNIKITSPRMDR